MSLGFPASDYGLPLSPPSPLQSEKDDRFATPKRTLEEVTHGNGQGYPRTDGSSRFRTIVTSAREPNILSLAAHTFPSSRRTSHIHGRSRSGPSWPFRDLRSQDRGWACGAPKTA